jgi:hypothetical protein
LNLFIGHYIVLYYNWVNPNVAFNGEISKTKMCGGSQGHHEHLQKIVEALIVHIKRF